MSRTLFVAMHTSGPSVTKALAEIVTAVFELGPESRCTYELVALREAADVRWSLALIVQPSQYRYEAAMAVEATTVSANAHTAASRSTRNLLRPALIHTSSIPFVLLFDFRGAQMLFPVTPMSTRCRARA